MFFVKQVMTLKHSDLDEPNGILPEDLTFQLIF